jgi:hypothetical protein
MALQLGTAFGGCRSRIPRPRRVRPDRVSTLDSITSAKARSSSSGSSTASGGTQHVLSVVGNRHHEA